MCLFEYRILFFYLVNSNHQPSTMKRDYYRGSQDSLADRGVGGGLLYKGLFFLSFLFILQLVYTSLPLKGSNFTCKMNVYK